MQRFLDLSDFTREQVIELLDLAARLQTHPEPRALAGRILGLLFLNRVLYFRNLIMTQIAVLQRFLVLFMRKINITHSAAFYLNDSPFAEKRQSENRNKYNTE